MNNDKVTICKDLKTKIVKKAPPTNRGVILPVFSQNQNAQTPTVIAFDWVEYTGKKQIEFLQKKSELVQVKDGVHPNFKKIFYRIANKLKYVADLTIDLKAGIDITWTKVKIQNKYCYQSGIQIKKMILDINENVGIDFKNFTRLDICCDFQATDYRYCTPQMIMDNIAKRKYVFKGRKCKTIEGTQKVNDYKVESLEVVSRGGRVETIRAGSRSSGMCITMYNKTKEMAAKVYKPWIIEQWNEAGFFGDIDTYRIEFNYMKTASTLVDINTDTGELRTLEHSNIDTLLKLNDIFNTLWNKYFCIGIAEKNKRFSRLKKVEILKFEKTSYVKTRLTEKEKSTNYIKAGIRHNIEYACDKINNQENIHGNEILLMVNNIVDRHGLNYWFKKNFPEIEQERQSITELLDVQTLKHIDFANGLIKFN